MIISLIHPSRGRSQKAFETYIEWIKQSSGNSGPSIQHILSIDNDDPDYKGYAEKFELFTSYPNSSVVEATNHVAKLSNGDIMIYLSDDFKCPQDWDLSLVEEFSKLDMSQPQLLKVDDCLQQFHVKVLTIPIMNRALYEKLGYFWHPNYKSMFVDEDLWWTCHNNGWITEAPHLKFEHHHPANGKAENDETYIRSAANWDGGREAFAQRKLLNFPI